MKTVNENYGSVLFFWEKNRYKITALFFQIFKQLKWQFNNNICCNSKNNPIGELTKGYAGAILARKCSKLLPAALNENERIDFCIALISFILQNHSNGQIDLFQKPPQQNSQPHTWENNIISAA